MRIVYVIDAYAVWGGIERVLADKMNYLVEHAGCEVTLLTVSQCNHPLTFGLHSSIRHVDLDVRMHQQYQYWWLKRLVKRLELEFLLKKRLSIALKDINPDVLVCTKLAFVDVLLDLKGEIPLVVESHTLCKSEKVDRVGLFRLLYIKFLKRSIRQTDALVALTEGDAADWSSLTTNVRVIPNIVHLNETGRYSNCSNKRAIFVGRLVEQKGIQELITIWRIVNGHHPDWQLDVYGDGHLDSISEIKLFVHPPTNSIMEEYNNSSILLMTSVYEPFGLVLPEAMSCGLPVVAFDCPYGPSSIISDGVDGFLVKKRKIDEFVQRVDQLICSYDLRRQMGQAGIQSSQRYQASRIMPQWIQLFEDLTSSRAE